VAFDVHPDVLPQLINDIKINNANDIAITLLNTLNDFFISIIIIV
tara:strand:+ start:440 stop:574 length:135 start_codon:yes stop_codon:yes gene_type:complete